VSEKEGSRGGTLQERKDIVEQCMGRSSGRHSKREK